MKAFPLRHLLFISIALISGLATSISARADSISYEIDFSTSSGPTVSSGSFQFDALGAVSTDVSNAVFTNLQAFVGSVLYTGTSPSDDIAHVNKKGVVKSLTADLEPADNPTGDILQLFITDHQYSLFDPTMTNVLGNGSYKLEVESESVPEPSTFLLLSLGLIGMIGAVKIRSFAR